MRIVLSTYPITSERIKNRLLLMVLVAHCAWSNVQSQSITEDTLLAKQFESKALDCIKRNQSDSAKLWHLKALELYEKYDVTRKWYESYRTLAKAWVNHKQPFTALDYLASVIREKRSVARTTEESASLLRICIYSGYICEITSDWEGGKENYELAFQLFVNDLGENNFGTANFLYHRLGNIYSRLGDFTSAQNMLQRGIDYGKKVGRPEIGKYGDLAIALNELGKYREALEVAQEGLTVPDMPVNALITTHLSEAASWLGLGDLPKALEATEKVPALIEQLEDEDEKAYYLGGYYARLGDVKSAMDDLESAIENYRKAVVFETQAHGTSHHREVGKNHYATGDCYLRKNNPEAALEEYQQTLQSVLPDFQPLSVKDNPVDTLFKQPENTIVEGLEGKARCFSALGDFEKALECYELIPSVEAKLLATHAFESSSLLAVEASRPRFDTAIGLAWNLYNKTRNVEYIQRAFHLTEQARGILLMHTIAQAQADYKLADSIRRKEYSFNVKLAWYEQQIAEERALGSEIDSSRLRQLVTERFLLVQNQTRFRTELTEKDPIYRNLSKNVTFRTASDVSGLLRPDQAFVDIYLTQQAAYVFLLGPRGALAWQKADLPPHFRDSTIQRFVEYLSSDKREKKYETLLAEDAWLKKTAVELYQLLLEPILLPASADIKALVVAPDDVLAFLPFELLQYESSQADWADNKFPFLLRKYSISYTYSATVLDRQQTCLREHKAIDRVSFAGFAPVYKNARDPQQPDKLLYPISDMKELVEAVQKMIGGKIFLGDAANETEFEHTAPLCRVLLLAMHGFANEENPVLSRLLFGNPQPTGTPDNVLYTNELQVTYLPADLVVLNACYTGFGKLQRGEGVYSVTRALTSAGVPATIMSIWQLSGASSRELVELFFQNIKSGMPKDVALQQAKITFLKDPEFESMWHPSFWAGLLATGDTSALNF